MPSHRVSAVLAAALLAWSCGGPSRESAAPPAPPRAVPPSSAAPSASALPASGGSAAAPLPSTAGVPGPAPRADSASWARPGGLRPASPAGASPGDPHLALKTALHDVHQALVGFYASNSRYPRDKHELETDVHLEGPVAALEKVTTGLTYSGDGGSFSLTVTRGDGPPVTLSGNNQRRPRNPSPAPERPAGT